MANASLPFELMGASPQPAAISLPNKTFTQEHDMLEVKILSCRASQQYTVKRTVRAALAELSSELPDINAQVVEVADYREIERFTSVLIFPSLVVNQRLVCCGRFPSKVEVKRWLWEAHAQGA